MALGAVVDFPGKFCANSQTDSASVVDGKTLFPLIKVYSPSGVRARTPTRAVNSWTKGRPVGVSYTSYVTELLAPTRYVRMRCLLFDLNQ